MQASNRIIINTLVQYVRSVVYMLLTLVSTRYVLGALGHSAYGVYAVIGSVVYTMGFLTQSLAVSTQRFLSVTHGTQDTTQVRIIFSNAFSLHALVSIALALLLFSCQPLCMEYLTLPDGMEQAGIFVYRTVVFVVMLSFLSAPIRALFIARENIVYVSVVEIIDAVLKLIGAIALPFIAMESLRAYTLLILFITLFNFMAYAVYARLKYAECRFFYWHDVSFGRMRKLINFAVWNVYAVGANVGRTQGLAIIMNHFMGTLVNAAYGIAQQVSNAAGFIGVSILNAINPQLMKAEGAGNRARMLMLATMESRYSFLALALVLIPVIIEMESLLGLWLGNVPAHAVMFCRFTLVIYIMDQLTIGLTSVNQAIGRIRNYSLLIGTLRLCTLPAAWICLHLSLPPTAVMWSYLGVELVIGLVRVPFMQITAGLPVPQYLKQVCVQTFVPIITSVVLSLTITYCIDIPFRFLITESVALSAGLVMIYFFTLSVQEKAMLHEKLNQLRSKL